MNEPFVSVHVVTYNQRAYIGETIESALTQDYANLGIVVSDDGSTDGTDAVVLGYAQRYPSRVVAITGGRNLGISGNSNRCLAQCSGKYVAFLAGDDLMLPGKIRAQVNSFEADPEKVLCTHDVEHFDSGTGRTLFLHSSIARPRTGAGVGEFLAKGYFPATSSIMVRRSAIPRRGFDERIKVHSDWKFAAECLLNGGKFGYVPGVYGRYRRHASNATTRYSSLLWEEFHVGLALLEAENPRLANDFHVARAHAYYQLGVSLLQRGRSEEGRAALGHCIRLHPTASWKLPMWWALSFVPPVALPEAVRRRLRLP